MPNPSTHESETMNTKLPTTGPTMAELPPPCEVRMFCRGNAINIQEFRHIDPETGMWVMGGIPTYVGHGVAGIKCKTDRGLQEIPHQFQFPITATNIADAFKAYEVARHDAFQVELSNLRRQALAQGATLDMLPQESQKR